MKVILAMVTSLNGKSTKDSLPPREWASKEDKHFLHKLINSQKLIVMGRKTYQAAKPIIKLSPKILRLVITNTPNKYKTEEVNGQLEFSNEPPKQLVNRLEKLDYGQMLLLGGAELNAYFFKENLINELWLTLEPLIFGKGMQLVEGSFPETRLKLVSTEKLNKQGTLLLKYRVNDSNSSQNT